MANTLHSKELIKSNELMQFIQIIGGIDNLKGIKSLLWGLKFIFIHSKPVNIEGINRLSFVKSAILGKDCIELVCQIDEQESYLFDYFVNNQKVNKIKGTVEQLYRAFLIIAIISAAIPFIGYMILDMII